jgi:hypothetical protein
MVVPQSAQRQIRDVAGTAFAGSAGLASRRNKTRRGSVMFTRSTELSGAAGSTAMTPNTQPAYSGWARSVSIEDGAGTVPPAFPHRGLRRSRPWLPPRRRLRHRRLSRLPKSSRAGPAPRHRKQLIRYRFRLRSGSALPTSMIRLVCGLRRPGRCQGPSSDVGPQRSLAASGA